MLVLAGMITLSIIGAIAAIPSGSLPPQARFEREARPGPQREQSPRPQAAPLPGETPSNPAVTRSASMDVTAAPPQRVEAAEWLEAIAYSLLSLTGLAVLAIILLWRALIQWRRSADALEALAARPH